MRKGTFDPISDDIRDHLHWLPIPQRVQFKLGLLVYKCLHGGAPPYLVEMLVQNSDVPVLRSLRSTARGCLVIPRTKTVTIGPRSFATTGQTFWNSLPTHFRDDKISLSCFKSSLKAYLFKQAYPNWYRFYMAQFVWTIWTVLDNLFHACMFLHEHKHHRDGSAVRWRYTNVLYITLHYISLIMSTPTTAAWKHSLSIG